MAARYAQDGLVVPKNTSSRKRKRFMELLPADSIGLIPGRLQEH
jgi:hypothetical protein